MLRFLSSQFTIQQLLHRFDGSKMKGPGGTRHFYLLKRTDRVNPALVTALPSLQDAEIEFSGQEWRLIEKVIEILQTFEWATQMLSHKDASASRVIPIVTTIVRSDQRGWRSRGNKESSLEEAMDDRDARKPYFLGKNVSCFVSLLDMGVRAMRTQAKFMEQRG